MNVWTCPPVPSISEVSVCVMELTGSPARRPEYRIAGYIVASDTLYPMAMLPARSTAALGMKRFLESGLYVDAWRALPIVPPVTGTWYQRTVAWLELLPATVWLSHSDSTPPMFVYWFCIIAR